MAGVHWRITLFGTGNGVNTQSVFHLREQDSGLTAEQVCNSVNLNFCRESRSLTVVTSFTWFQVKAEKKGAANQEQFLKAVDEPGAMSGVMLPGQCAVVWNLLTQVGGGKPRGKFFHPGNSTVHLSAAKLSALGVSNHNALAAKMLAAYGPSGSVAGLKWAVLSRKGDSLHDVLAVSVQSIYGTLRSRRLGVGF